MSSAAAASGPLPRIAVVAAALLGWGAMTLYTASLTSQRQDIVNWCNDNSASFLASNQDAEAAAQFRSLTQYADGMTDLLDGYPDVTSSLLHRVEAAGGAAITIPVHQLRRCHGRAAVQRQLQSGHRHSDLHSLAAELRRFFNRELYRLQRR